MAKMTNHFMCPNCDSSWGIEEISFQECDCCGYPDNEDDEVDFDNEYDYDEDDYNY